MSSDSEDIDINWDNLQTITTFDNYDDNVRITGSQRLLASQFIGTLAAKASTPVSLLVESLVQQLCNMLEPDPTSSSELYHKICSHLHKMNLIDGTYEMGEFEVMRSQYQKALFQLVTVARGQDVPLNLQSVWPLTHPLAYDWSRYHREFEEIQFISGGGFGKVYKVRHKLDGIIYAVKKVTIKSQKIDKVLRHLAEVKTFAALSHNNIVPYKACWLEPLLADQKQTTDNSNDSSTEDEEFTTSESGESPIRITTESDNSSFIQFERSENAAEVDDESRNKSIQGAVTRYSSQSSLNFDPGQQPYIKLKWATLYIQMAMCHMTLRDWLDMRNKSDNFQTFYRNFLAGEYFNSPAVSRQMSRSESVRNSGEADVPAESPLDVAKIIFSQLIDGLDYIHSQNIIHHDIKPSNLFINVEGGNRILLQLGDFGLACPLQDDHSKNVVGTPTYAAPEQLEGKCDKKSDVYSIGIVLLELLMFLRTDMERVETIRKARDGKIPEEIPHNFVSLLKKLFQPISHRPDIKQVMQLYNQLIRNDIPLSIQQELQELRNKIQIQKSIDKEFSDELQSKTVELQCKDKEIASLQRKIHEMELKEIERQSKDAEIERLRKLLEESHVKEQQ